MAVLGLAFNRSMQNPARVQFRPDYSTLFPAEQRSWSRAIAAQVQAASRRSDPSKIVKAAWPNDDRALEISKGAVTPTTTAGYPTFDPVVAYRSLAPSSAALSLFQMGTALSLDGVTTIHIPSFAAMPVQPIFVEEGKPAPNVQWSLAANIVLGPVRKILMMSAVTEELQDATPDTASAVIGRMLADIANRGIDTVAFGSAAADTKQPAGLLHAVVPIGAATAGVDALAQDLGNLTGAIGVAGIDPSGAVFVCGPREATMIKIKASQKFDNPVLTTLGLPAKTVACFAPAGIFSGYQDAPQIETRKSPAVHFEGSTPADITNGGVAAPVKSSFQAGLISIKVRGNCSWAAAPGAAQVITVVNW
jgi:hypothetical protein